MAFCLLVTFSYIQGITLVHACHHEGLRTDKHLTLLQTKKEINCKICDYLVVKQAQQLPAQIFTLTEVYRSKPLLLQRLDLAVPCKITLASFLNKGPPMA